MIEFEPDEPDELPARGYVVAGPDWPEGRPTSFPREEDWPEGSEMARYVRGDWPRFLAEVAVQRETAGHPTDRPERAPTLTSGRCAECGSRPTVNATRLCQAHYTAALERAAAELRWAEAKAEAPRAENGPSRVPCVDLRRGECPPGTHRNRGRRVRPSCPVAPDQAWAATRALPERGFRAGNSDREGSWLGPSGDLRAFGVEGVLPAFSAAGSGGRAIATQDLTEARR